MDLNPVGIRGGSRGNGGATLPNLDVYRNGALTVQHAGEHGDALFSKRVGRYANATPP